MTTLSQGFQQSEYLISEVGDISHSVVTVTSAGTAMRSGTVLGRITATGKYVAYASGASDGSQNAAGILNTPVPAAAGDYQAKVHLRLCEVDKNLLTVSTAAVIAGLAATHIIVRG